MYFLASRQRQIEAEIQALEQETMDDVPETTTEYHEASFIDDAIIYKLHAQPQTTSMNPPTTQAPPPPKSQSRGRVANTSDWRPETPSDSKSSNSGPSSSDSSSASLVTQPGPSTQLDTASMPPPSSIIRRKPSSSAPVSMSTSPAYQGQVKQEIVVRRATPPQLLELDRELWKGKKLTHDDRSARRIDVRTERTNDTMSLMLLVEEKVALNSSKVVYRLYFLH